MRKLNSVDLEIPNLHACYQMLSLNNLQSRKVPKEPHIVGIDIQYVIYGCNSNQALRHLSHRSCSTSCSASLFSALLLNLVSASSWLDLVCRFQNSHTFPVFSTIEYRQCENYKINVLNTAGKDVDELHCTPFA